MHIRDLAAFARQNQTQVFECIGHCQRYYSEMEFSTGGMHVLNQSLRLPRETQLSDLIRPRQYTRLRRSIQKSFGLDLDHFQHLYPMIIANYIQTSVLSQTSEAIMDLYLYQFAVEQEKELHFLESQLEQVALFQRIPLNLQVKSLLALGRQPSRARRQILDILQEYTRQNTRQLYQRSKRQLGKLRRMLLYQRNEAMAAKLIEELEEHSGFVGVGAAHLFGYSGILRLMKKDGYKIRPL